MSSPYPPFGTQNLNDDDGPVLDSMFVETFAPPPLKDAIEPIPIPARVEPTRSTRLFAGVEILAGGGTPFRLLPADANRIEFNIGCVLTSMAAGGFNDYVLVADENGKVSTGQTNSSTGGSFRLRPAMYVVTFRGHTGEIWIAGGISIAAAMEVEWWAVTK
jgi:hypothetical protein